MNDAEKHTDLRYTIAFLRNSQNTVIIKYIAPSTVIGSGTKHLGCGQAFNLAVTGLPETSLYSFIVQLKRLLVHTVLAFLSFADGSAVYEARSRCID